MGSRELQWPIIVQVSDAQQRLVFREASMACAAECIDAVLNWSHRDIWSCPLAVKFVKGELSRNAVTDVQWRALHQTCYSFNK
jgi:hypothetical protein